MEFLVLIFFLGLSAGTIGKIKGSSFFIWFMVGAMLPGMAYLVRRLLENTANESFLRASFTDQVPVERLLRNPVEAGKAQAAH